MKIRPQEFEVSEELLRKRLELPPDAFVFPFGYEGLVDDALIRKLKTRYDSASLYFRTRPDFMVIDSDQIYLVEAKQRTKNVEAIQLFFNKCLERMGIGVVYSFPDFQIHARDIPMERIVIPKNYKEKFDAHLKHLFESEGVTDFCYVRSANEGSGDAFVPVEFGDLIILGDGLA